MSVATHADRAREPHIKRVVLFVFLLLLALLGRAVAQETSDEPSEPRVIALPVPARSLIQAGPRTILALTEDGRRAMLIHGDQGEVQLLPPFDGEVVALASARNEAAEPVLAMLERLGGADSIDYRLVVLAVVEGKVPIRWSRVLELSGLRQPAIGFVLGREDTLLLWDRRPNERVTPYFLATQSDLQRRDAAKFVLSEFAALGSGPLLLGVGADSGSAILTNVIEARTEDTLFTEVLLASNPVDLAVFAPEQRLGGTGDVIVGNLEAKLLTVLSLAKRRLPRIASPLQFSLKDVLVGRAEDGSRLLVGAERDLSFILVGFQGGSRFSVLRRIGDSLQADQKQTIELGLPVRDILVLDREAGTLADGFAFLGADGREIQLVPEIRDLLDATNEPIPAETPAMAFPGTDLDVADIPRLQRVLARLGYSVGAVDGMIGGNTEAAIRAFQFDRKLPVTGLIDQSTIDALNAVVGDILSAGGSQEYVAAYAEFLKEHVPGLPASRMLTLGASHESPDSPCFGLNSVPPRDLWSNSVPIAKVLKRLLDEGLKVEIVSGFRSAAYVRCASRGGAGSEHMKFRAFDLRLEDAETSAESMKRLKAVLTKLRDEGLFKGGIGSAGQTVHVDTRGFNVDFGSPFD